MTPFDKPVVPEVYRMQAGTWPGMGEPDPVPADAAETPFAPRMASARTKSVELSESRSPSPPMTTTFSMFAARTSPSRTDERYRWSTTATRARVSETMWSSSAPRYAGLADASIAPTREMPHHNSTDATDDATNVKTVSPTVTPNSVRARCHARPFSCSSRYVLAGPSTSSIQIAAGDSAAISAIMSGYASAVCTRLKLTDSP